MWEFHCVSEWLLSCQEWLCIMGAVSYLHVI